jgi:hypothetical protein
VDELDRIVADLRAEGDILHLVAVGHPSLMAALVPVMQRDRIRGFVHPGGPDAADLALIERIRCHLPARADTVVICSGDHAFAPVARELRAAGKHVIVIARFGGLSARLYVASSEVRIVASMASAHSA